MGSSCVCINFARNGDHGLKILSRMEQRDAERAARAIAKSPLAKTSWFGKDPNWGRVLAAAGYSGAVVDKPTIGDPTRAVESADIRRANRLMTTGGLLALAICCALCVILDYLGIGWGGAW